MILMTFLLSVLRPRNATSIRKQMLIVQLTAIACKPSSSEEDASKEPAPTRRCGSGDCTIRNVHHTKLWPVYH